MNIIDFYREWNLQNYDRKGEQHPWFQDWSGGKEWQTYTEWSGLNTW